MANVEELKKERTLLFSDLYAGKTPKRVPVSNPMQLEACATYCGTSIAETNWDHAKIEEVLDKVGADFPSDTGAAPGRRYPFYYQLLGAKPFVMSSSGHMQHPNVHGMEPEDYDLLIKSPYDCIMERILPRLYRELDTTPELKMLALGKAQKAQYDDFGATGAIMGKVGAKYGHASVPGGATTAPFDFLADFFRSFTLINGDLRRYPEKVIQACDALLPILVKKGQIAGPPPKFSSTIIPLHMGTFLQTKDFEKFYWPSLKKQVEMLTEMGINVQLFVEDDYTRYLDHLQDLPANTILRFEYGDPKLFTEKLGKKFVISGFYPISILHEGTKAQAVDEAKRLLDIVMPRARFWFNPDKGPMDTHGNFNENQKAVLAYVLEHGAYDNPDGDGTLFEKQPNRCMEIIGEIDKNLSANSKYFKNWKDYVAAHPEIADRKEPAVMRKMMMAENQMFSFIINLCS
jgi:hypothetical protein